MKKRADSEHRLQCQLIIWAGLHAGRWPALHLLFAIPNGAAYGGGTKTLKSGAQIPVAAIRAHRMKAEGLRPGVPDLCLPVARGGFHGLFLELKTSTGRLRPDQALWIDALRDEGYRAEVAHGLDEAIAVLRGYVAGAVTSPTCTEA